MKSTGLMIGDYVLYNNEVARVTSLSENVNEFKHGVSDTIVRDGLTGIKPISLTAEILKKNGFKEQGLARCTTFRLFVENDFIIIESFYDNKVGKYNWAVGVHSHYTGCQCAMIHYVHELQHALRLYGIDKEIKL